MKGGPTLNGYILDLDGTVYRGERLIPGAAEAIGELKRRGRRVVFLSNKPLYSRRDYADKLTRLGIPTSEGEVINSSLVLARLLAREAPGAKVFAIGDPPLLEKLARAGLELSDDPEEIEYVIAAFGRTFDYHKLGLPSRPSGGGPLLGHQLRQELPGGGREVPEAGLDRYPLLTPPPGLLAFEEER